MTDPYSPSPELVEAARHAAFPRYAYLDVEGGEERLLAEQAEKMRVTLTAAVAFRHPDGYPELVPWEQVPELWSCPDCAFTMDACHTDVSDGGYTCPLCENERLRSQMRELVEACAAVLDEAVNPS